MQFLVILGIGALVAIWVVANQPKSRGRRGRRHGREFVAYEGLQPKKPAWRGELDEVYSLDELDYIRKMARHNDDPRHWPPPLPPPKKAEFGMDCN